MSIIHKIVTSASWNVAGQLGSQIISFCSMIVLARLLDPSDFGLVAMSYVCRSLAMVFASMGMSSAVIQRKNLDEEYLSTAFWTSMIAGVIIAVVMLCISPLIAGFFGRKELTAIIIVSSVTFIIGGASSTHRAVLERDMKFKQLSGIDIAGQVLGSSVGIFSALTGLGYWSLVIQEIAANCLRVPLLWAAARWRPSILFNKKKFKELFSFSSYVLFTGLVNFFNRNGDNIIIGRVLGAVSLGFYDLAYNLMLKPLQYISATTGKALFPALSKIQDDKKTVRETYVQMVRIISLITFPMMTGLSIVAPDLITLIYGSKWSAAIPVFQILCFVGLWQSIGTTVGVILLSQGRSKLAFKMTLFVSPFVWIAFYAGTRWGIVGVAWAYAVVSATWWLVSHSIANRLIDLSMGVFLKSLLPAAFCCTGMAVVLKMMEMLYIAGGFSRLGIVSAHISLGVFSYAGLLFAIQNPELKKAISIATQYRMAKKA